MENEKANIKRSGACAARDFSEKFLAEQAALNKRLEEEKKKYGEMKYPPQGWWGDWPPYAARMGGEGYGVYKSRA